jgi:putative hydrolase of the HAD superfamily
MKYKAVIFDLFGTLIDNFSRPEYMSVLKEMATILDVPKDSFVSLWFDKFIERSTGVYKTTEDAIRYTAGDLNPVITEKQIARAAKIRLEYTRNTINPRPGAAEVLGSIRASGYGTGLISDCTCEITAVWDSTALAPLFDVAVFSCVAGIKKPDPRIYRMATEGLGVEPRDCLYIGDGSSHELTGALQAGMHPVLIRVPYETSDDHYLDREEDWEGPVISSLREVPDLLTEQ